MGVQIRKALKVLLKKRNDMGYLIFDTDRDDEMRGLRNELKRNYRGDNYHHLQGGSNVSMREHYYRMGYRDSREVMEREHEEMYRRERDSRGRYM